MLLIFPRRHARQPAILRHQVETPGVHDFNFDASDFDGRRWRWAGRWFGPRFRRWWRNKVRAKQRGGAGVIEDAEHELARFLVNARAASDHLMEQNRRMDVAEEDYVADARHVDAGGQQVFGRGDDVRPLTGAEIRDERLSTNGGHAFEGVDLQALLFVIAAPPGVEPVQLVGHKVRVVIARAKNDGLLQGVVVSGFLQALKEVCAHGLHALRHDEARFERRAFGARGDILGGNTSARQGVGQLLVGHVVAIHTAHALR